MNTTVLNIINEYSKKSKKQTYWDGSQFEPMLKLSSDERGEIGEKIINDLVIKLTDLDVEWEQNQNVGRTDGDIWDILINNQRTEVKLAMRGSTKATWQHEKIVEEKCWDKIIFIDLDYNGIWFSIQNYGQIPYGDDKHEITGTKSTYHLGGWKFDLSPTKIKKLEEKGLSMYYDIQNPDDKKLSNFLNKHLG